VSPDLLGLAAFGTLAALFVGYLVLISAVGRVAHSNARVAWDAARADMGPGTIVITNEAHVDGPLAAFQESARRRGFGWLAPVVSRLDRFPVYWILALAGRVDGTPVACLLARTEGTETGVLAAERPGADAEVEVIDPAREPFPPPALARRLEALAARAAAPRKNGVPT
jgi:hypothetical protein